ncbi:MAG: alpha/beta hydrolase [Novosphingobium sp.]|uniref:alpha/beta fold hydrolase n=1 Tax=Novosphingobium sp. TaxID=1874826 RepID=UPI0012C87034|nr:alpha/beta hydrolase [Novosphingobium sp.]MPS69676.1 alpha/beta hydrolase [Novosphingobium sp.]
MDANSFSESEMTPLVILPGLLCDGRMFGGQLSAFPASMTVNGFYGGADSIEAMADYALARMPGRCALLGHSMGARVALEVSRKAPERVTRLALADTGIHPVRPGEKEKRYALRDLGRREGFGALVDAWLPPMIGPSRRGDIGFYASLRAMCMGSGQVVFEAQIEALLHRPEVGAVLAALECPVSLMVGDSDAWSPVDQHREIAEALGGAPLTIVADAGHMAPAERPDAFNAALRGWLALQPALTIQNKA